MDTDTDTATASTQITGAITVKAGPGTPSLRQPAALAAILGCTAVLGWAGLRADAAWHEFAARTIIGNVTRADAIDPAGLDAAAVRIDRALARFPRHADVLDLAGQLKTLRAGQPGVVGRERREWLEAAAGDHRRALAQRPIWPYSWAGLLSVKDALGQADSEFANAMYRATATGPWEPRVQSQVLRSGIRYWDELGTKEHELLRRVAADALRLQPREAFGIARFYARPDLVCGVVPDQPEIERWCSSVSSWESR